MTTTTTTDRRPSLLLQATRLLLGLFGAAKLYGTAYFTFFATADEGGVQSTGDWLVAAWSAALAVTFLVAAVLLGRDRRVVPLLVGALLLDVCFGLVKLVGYGEEESLVFTGVTVLLVLLVAAVVRQDLRRPPAAG